MNNLESYAAQDRAYLQAHTAASEMMRAKQIVAYCVSHDREHGRMIHVESDQGWDPAPFFQEFEDQRAFAPPPN